MTLLRDLCTYCRKTVPAVLARGAWTVAGRFCLACGATFGRVYDNAKGDAD